MSSKSFFFAGGGTGGHIYPAIAIAERILQLNPAAEIRFFCSMREIDIHIFSNAGFDYTPLPARGFSLRPDRLTGFVNAFFTSARMAGSKIAESENPTVIGLGGFVAGAVCYAGHKLNAPVVLLNVDIVPGKANKLLARWAKEIFVQFEDTTRYFANRKANVSVVGCPLRNGFDKPAYNVIEKLGLDKDKKTLLVTGASSGSANINEAVCMLLEKLSVFADKWQIVHLAGRRHSEAVQEGYAGAKIGYTVLDYYDDMPSLLQAAELVVGRSGAVSVAEYAAASVPSICMPYPYHRDRHQYLNAGWLVDGGAGIIVDDLPAARERADRLAQELEELMGNDEKRRQMRIACEKIGRKDAAVRIAEKLLGR
jgi:UDP-N-acetylglucosamine--N-acetylmuramyl-(pentapeptide) pyrophosphoryl-undecaprenol N-acetylglucosamine transferase